MQEVTHARVDEPVVQVAEPARDDQREGDVREPVARSRPSRKDPQRERDRADRERREEPAPARAQAEHRAGVQHEFQFEQVRDDGDRLVRGNDRVDLRGREREHGLAAHTDRGVGDAIEGEVFGAQVERERDDRADEQDRPRPRGADG